MHTALKSILSVILSVFILYQVTAAAEGESGLVAYHGVTLAESSVNDGDSFMVNAGDETLHIRLYFVDCPETVANTDHDARRVQEQARYFGIDSAERIMWLGEQAGHFTRQVLSRPFTLYTSHTRALGGAGSQRIYGFIETANGRDLGELLVENGFGRNFGVRREPYDGSDIEDMTARLEDREAAAMLSRLGIWSESNASKLAEYRAAQREEQAGIRKLMNSNVVLLEQPVDLNSATRYELEKVPGIGPVTAGRIIQFRPYTAVEDLIEVPGIGPKTIDRIRPYVKVEPSGLNG